jgi:hypothetical protein
MLKCAIASGLSIGDTIMLKRTVEIDRKEDVTTIQHALWAVDVPNAWIDMSPDFQRVLTREVDLRSYTPATDEQRGLMELLEVQGCFEPPRKPQYDGSEVLTMFENAVNAWYAVYYKHPLWTHLLQGCSRNHLASWLIQNYHLSRSAGVTDSRCAMYFPQSELRHHFRRTALEEYWHCDAFFFVKHPLFGIAEEDVKRYIPLPASMAFDQQMLAVAESDPLAYVMVSYLQGSSVRFSEGAKQFYRKMEAQYGLTHFFSPWEKHATFDFEYEYGEHYAEMFSHFSVITATDLEYSFRNAATALGFLIGV